MAGIMNKISETLHMGGGHKEEDKHKAEEKHGYSGEHKTDEKHGHSGEHKEKEGFMEKVKDKIHGGDSKEHCESGEKKKKKDKKEKKKHDDGHESSSSSDSD